MLLKIAVVLTVAILIYTFFIKKKRVVKDGSEEIVTPCVVCGVFVGESESIVANSRCYCSQECLRKGVES